MKIASWALALALLAACGREPTAPSAPLDHIRMPTGLAVQDHRLLVASSNADLFYDTVTGGSVLSLDAGTDPGPIGTVTIAGALNVRSFAGELAIARPDSRFSGTPGMPDAESCGTAADLLDTEALAATAPLALFATRGSNTLNVLSIAPDGALSCEGCGLSAATGFGDPFAMAIACGGHRARAYFGYLSTANAFAVVGELDLKTFALRTDIVGIGQVHGLAYDRDRDRLFVTGNASATPTPLYWVDLGGCAFGAAPTAGGCTVGSAFLTTLPAGLELRAIALANPGTPGNPAPRAPGVAIRAYATGRLYDTTSAATSGFRTTDFGGLLIVLDLLDDGLGGVQPRVVWTVPIGRGAQDIRVLPARPGKRDAVVAMSVDEGQLTIYDDDTRSVAVFRMDEATGAPILGHQPFGFAIDPVPLGSAARVWVGSYTDSIVTPIDVPLAAPDLAAFVPALATSVAPLQITGAMP